MAVCTEEAFGLVVSVYEWGDEDDVVERVNDSEYGLNASIWTADTDYGRELAERLETGAVNINDAYSTAWASLDAPMGGVNDSGIGRRHGREGIMKYTESQTVAVKEGFDVTNPPLVPHWLYAKLLNEAMKLQRRIPGLR
jgi:succinate-semialdehyde dehydrogenase/glutarate-semialdehyde dehydrogenase